MSQARTSQASLLIAPRGFDTTMGRNAETSNAGRIARWRDPTLL